MTRPPAASSKSSGGAAASVVTQLKRLGDLKGVQLRGEWQRFHRMAPPRFLSRDLLRRGIAHGIQERAYGGLNQADRRRLSTLAQLLGKQGYGALDAAPSLKPGATLVRDWHGEAHRVRVLAQGFEYKDRRYRSLSEIARVITSARWSGPRFFGLGQQPTSSRQRAKDE